MPVSRFLLLVFGFCLILGLMIWLVTSISGLYSQIAWSAHPIFANLFLLLIFVLLGLLIFAFFYYTGLFKKTQKSRKRRAANLQVPVDKTEAAEESLKTIRQQVHKIQDEVARQAIINRTDEIEEFLSRGNIKVVIFGTGSAGKTSIVNALMGRMVGKVNAPMGTTEVGETYHLQLKGLEREILITDTPGILEAGEAGSHRGTLARTLATEADLLLFVVDNDLRQSEYQPLYSLAEIGKRSLLVFNKIDRYTEDDQNIILSRLEERVKTFISPEDIVRVAANPQGVILDTGEQFKPEPDIMPLIRQMAKVLRAEGEDLIADNILLQSQRLGEEARHLLDTQRRRQANKVVERFQWIGAGVIAVTPLPVVDLLATAAVNAQMVVEIGKIYGCELNLERGRELALSLAKTLASLGVVQGATQLVATALQFHFGTIVIGKGIQAVTAAYLTRIAGKSFIEYFRQDQDWGDGGMAEVVQRQFKLTRKDEFVKSFIQDAIARVIEPLNLNQSRIEEDENDDYEDESQLEYKPSVQLKKVNPFENDWHDRDYKREDW
ncbi:YcjF family protein [Lyngbya sp. PCC 8106]|uniref:YcjF family protein n=1 Tax=Lyngbya sp. (strain PCC 8106) TaxID=313612 RepID=UPI0000EAD9CC|nr:GTP-binding protein [Lyngbya sp. PCC 8106]EAW33534.1 Small GTP-binding protein domain protein [Lyngbya sp. PCC 8106]